MAKAKTGQQLVNSLPRDSWLSDWMDVWPTAEAPKSYILFAGMMVLGACLGRKVWYRQDWRKLWPMLNLLLIGPSGIGKSTSIHMGRWLLDGLPKAERPQFITGGATPEALHSDLLPNPHAILFASELANFFNRQKYMEGMIPYVTELLDYNPVEKRTKHGGVVRIDEPSVTVVGGSTVDWLQEQLPDSAAAGGFLARFLIVSEKYRSQRVALPGEALTRAQQLDLDRKRETVLEGFRQVVLSADGEMRFAGYDAMDAYVEWYNRYEPDTGHLAPFAARAGEFVLRLTMILAASRYSPEMTADDITTAVKLYEYCAGKLQDVVVPYSLQGKMHARVLDALGQDGATDVQLKRAMRNYCSAQETQKVIESLLMQKEIKCEPGGKYVRIH